MTPEYEFIDIDPANPPEMPLDGCLFSDDDFVLKNKSNELPRTLTEIYFSKSGKMLFADHNGIIWKCCKIPKEKPIDFRNRWVKIKAWTEMEKEYGLDHDKNINTHNYAFTKDMESKVPANRVVFTDHLCFWNTYCITPEMISEILPIDYQPERELDDTVVRFWIYQDGNGIAKTTYAYTERGFLSEYEKAKIKIFGYAPGPIIPDQSEWRKV